MSGINDVTNTSYAPVQNTGQATSTANNAQAAETKEEQNTQVAADEYAGSVPTVDTKTYSKMSVKPDMDKINEMKASMKNNVGAFEMMVNDMMKNNGVGSFNASDDKSWSRWVSDVVSGQYKVSASESAEATAAISEDGYWGVEKTSQRIVDFAKAISGGDIEQYDKLLSAIEKGFGGAKEAWGRDMPDITKQTYDATMEKMKAWKEEAQSAASASNSVKTDTQQAVQASQGVQAN